MIILSISSILPVPGLSKENDFVIETYSNYLKKNPDHSVTIIKPVRINLNPLRYFRNNNHLKQIRKLHSYDIKGLHVEVLPFISAWRMRNLHALVSRTIYTLNAKRLQALHRSLRFDVIHAQFILPDGFLAHKLSKKWGIPYLLTSHNEKFYFEHKISRQIATNILYRASAVLPINHFNYSYFQSIDIPRLRLLPIGFDQRFLKDQKSTSGKPLKILSVCTLIKLKNIDKVIEAVGILAEKYDIVYTIVGQGPERELLERLATELDLEERVIFKGPVPYEIIDEEMYHHDLFIMPSFFETFGRVYFESMAMGIPVICARNSGIFGMFREGIEAFSVDHNDISSIVTTLDTLISNEEKRKAMGISGKKLVEGYTWSNVVETLEHTYNEAIRNSSYK